MVTNMHVENSCLQNLLIYVEEGDQLSDDCDDFVEEFLKIETRS